MSSERLHTKSFLVPDTREFDSVPVPPQLPEGWFTGEASGEQTRQAERLEYNVFLAAGFCDPSDTGRVAEFEPWRDATRFQVVVSPDGEVQGTVRVMVGTYDSLPVGKFDRDLAYPADPVVEYASLALPPHQRKVGIAEALYRSVWMHAIRANASGLVAIAETWLFGILNDTYNFGFIQLGPSRWYMGGECLPIGTSMDAVLQRFKRQPTFFRWLSSEIDLRDLDESDLRGTVQDVRSSSDPAHHG